MNSWSNPQPAQTGPELQRGERATGPAANFGPLVAAILAQKQQRRADEQRLVQAVQGIAQNRQEGRLADYMSQYETNPDQSAQIAGMSGPTQLRAAEWTSQRDQQDRQFDLQDQYRQAQEELLRARANNANAPADDYTQLMHQQLLDERQAKLDAMDMTKGKAQSAALLGKQGPELEAEMAKIGAYSPGSPGSQVAATDANTWPGPATDTSAQKDAKIAAYYRAVGQKIPPGMITTPGAVEGGGMYTPATDQTQQAPITTTTPPAAAIAALRANPNMSADFDAKYGQGAAQQYLGQ